VLIDFGSWYHEAWPSVAGALVVAAQGDRDAGQDAASEAFSRAFERWERVGDLESPEGWTYVVGRNVLRRRLRGRGRIHLVGSQIELAAPDRPGPEPELWVAIADLPDRQRTLVLMRYVLDMTQGQIARELGIADGTVASGLSQARRSLAVVLGDQESPPSVKGATL